MGSLRDIRRRIGSVKNTRQITRAMKLVAGAKLRRATNAATAAKPYQQSLSRMLERVVASAGEIEHPLLESPDNETDVLIAVISSDRGLCGGFNNQLFRKLAKDIAAFKADGKTVRLLCYGKKARSHFGARDYTILESFVDLAPENYSQIADALADKLAVAMGKSEFSQAYVAYNEYISVMKQQASLVSVLPMRLDDEAEEDGAGGEYLYEPDGTQILAHLLPTALRTQIFQAFLESQAGEQAARMRAMDSATRNASELIDTLTLDYNRARQAAITTELTEIVSGAEAL